MPQAQEFISQVYFKINGTDASRDMERGAKEIVVDTSLYLPDMFSIQLNDPDLSLMDSEQLEIGKKVEISAKATGESQTKSLTEGVIVAVEPEFGEYGVSITVRGYDESHNLHRGKKTRVFQQMSDSDIVKKIAQENGVNASIDSTSVVHEHVFQDNQSDMEFIFERARRNGYLAYVENGRLYFKTAATKRDEAATLKWGSNLIRFQARFTSAGQIYETEVRGWDVKQKKAITGTSSSPVGTPTVAGENHGGKLAAKALNLSLKSREIVHNSPLDAAGEADSIAQAVLNDRCQSFFQAEGTCRGNPAIRAGKDVEIQGLGNRFSGKYMITRAIHRFDETGYITDFEISGMRPNTIRQLLSGEGDRTHYGVLPGIVTNVKDPENMARVKVKFPTIMDTLESAWARLATPMAGKERGIEFLPEVNDEVLVAFEYNDINRPYIIGSLWNGEDKPPETNSNVVGSDGKVNKRVIKSRSGHVITLDDTAKGEKITIIDKAGQKIIMDSSGGKEKIEVIDKTGKSKILMDAAQRSVSIESAMDLTIKATGKVQIEGQTGVAINAKGNVDIKSDGQANIKGVTASLQGTAQTEVKSTGILTVKGSMVQIN
jgi:phage protein D